MALTDKLFINGLYENEWHENLMDFYGWLASEQRKCEPRGIHCQSMSISSGYVGLLNKYPTFEDAYIAYVTYVGIIKKEMNNRYVNGSPNDATDAVTNDAR